MKLILSKKGFDSQYGGVPSPIMPDGSLCSLTIPSSSGLDRLSYGDAKYGDLTLGNIVSSLTGNRIGENDQTHFDPDIRKEALPRKAGWLPAFGQVGQAQSHLEKNHVGLGDIFLFFGWFRKTQNTGNLLSYEHESKNLHVLFGWLQIGAIYKPSANKENLPKWACSHPHVESAKDRSKNNTLYVATNYIDLPGIPKDIPGGGVFPQFKPVLCLTAPESKKRSLWRLPAWFYPGDEKPPLTFHSNLNRWHSEGRNVMLETVGRGQEFVLDCDYYPEITSWLKKIFSCAF
jgi:hypothetical protein